MENKECKVVQDLLPNYIEKLTSEETNKFIEEHLEACPECQAMLESMKEEIKINTAKQDDREVEYIKKFNVKFKKVEYKLFVLIYTILAVLIIGTTIFFGRKYIIFQNIAKKASEYTKSTNFYIKKYTYMPDDMWIDEYWAKDGNIHSFKTVLRSIIEDCYTTEFTVKDGKLYIIDNGEVTSIVENYGNSGDIEVALSQFDIIQTLLSQPLSVFAFSLDTAALNGKECYTIRFNNSMENMYYIEKETGLITRQEGGMANYPESNDIKGIVIDYLYKFDKVTDRDLEKKGNENYETENITQEAKLGEATSIANENLNIEISNLSYNEAEDKFKTDIKFSTVDNKGLSTEIIYDYIIYDADSNIVASSLPIGMTPEKNRIAEKFARKHYNGTNYADFVSHMIGVAEQRTNMSEEGIVYQTLTVTNLDKKLNLENLSIIITNIKYKHKGEPEIIEPEKDYIFTFGKYIKGNS